MAFHKPEQIAELVIEAGVQKVSQTLPAMLILGFLGGAFISLGFLLNIRVLGNLPERVGEFSKYFRRSGFSCWTHARCISGRRINYRKYDVTVYGAICKENYIG